MKPSNIEITLIGNDPPLAYLISRFAEQSGCRVVVLQVIPTVEEIWARKPGMILFLSMESLESAKALMRELADGEIPVVVCASVSDEARARELGADHCLVHPLTYDGFMAAFLGEDPSGISGPVCDKPQTDG